MKNFITLLLLLASVNAEAQAGKFNSYPNTSTIQSGDLFLLSRGGNGTFNINGTQLPTAMGIPSWMQATNSALQAQLSASNAVYQAQLTNNIALTNMSPLVGNNEYADMRVSVHGAGRSLGISFGGSNHAWLWTANGIGTGSNVWGGDFSFPGGILNNGNPYWQDLPQTTYQDRSVYWGMGPAASMATNAWPNGQTNPSTQPGFRIVNANPFSGIAYIDLRTAFTNSSHGSFVGTNYSGVSMYLPTFGLTIGPISDAYGNPDPITGIIDQTGKYSQQAPSYQGGILSDPSLNYYISENLHRTGDPSYGGQAPLFTIQTDQLLDGNNTVNAGFPIQIPSVWDVRQQGNPLGTNWQWALVVNESSNSPTVATTNSLLKTGNILGNSTNKGSYVFGRLWDAATAQTEFQGTVNFDLPSQVYGNYGAFTFDAVGSHRFGVVVTSGEYPHLGHASGSPFNISQYSATDLSAIDAGHIPTFTNELTINADSTVTISNVQTNKSDLRVEGVIYGNGSGLTNLNASQLTSGTVPDAAIAANIARTNQLLSAAALVANQFMATDSNTNPVSTMNGTGLTNLNTFDSLEPTFTGTAFWLGTNSVISCSSNIYIISFANIPPSGIERYGQLTIKATGDLTVTNLVAGGVVSSDMVSSRTLTNGNSLVISADVSSVATNIAVVQFH